jgi:hypothetical protein
VRNCANFPRQTAYGTDVFLESRGRVFKSSRPFTQFNIPQQEMPDLRHRLGAVFTAGFYHSPGWNKDYPKIQILTITDLLDGLR